MSDNYVKNTMFPSLFPGTVPPAPRATPVFDLNQFLAEALERPVPNTNRQKLARTGDPATSHQAAESLTTSGARYTAKKAVLSWVKRHPDSTSAELAGKAPDTMGHPTIHKRLPDLRRDGLVVNGPVRTCTVTGRPSLTWRAA